MKRIIIAISLVAAVCLTAGVTHLHYKGHGRRIARKIYSYVQHRNGPTNETDGYYSVTFNDRNSKHMDAATRLGLKRPLRNRSEAEGIKSNLVRIRSNSHYKVEKLTHSVPYLTSGAAELLDMIGKNFLDSLKSKGMKPYRIIVTSVLRTQEDITRLKESGNTNSSSNSAHRYATTFDITYARFAKAQMKNFLRYKSADTRTLTTVLGEVLHDLKRQKKCYVKYEVRQKCFHITTRI